MLDKLNSSNTDIVNSKYSVPLYTYYSLNIYNKEENIKELLFNIEEILHNNLSIPIKNYHIFIQSLYYLLQNCNLVLKYNLNRTSGNNISTLINFNFIIILNNNTIFQVNINTIEKLLQGNQPLPYFFNLSLKQDIPNNTQFFNIPKIINLQFVKNPNMNVSQLTDTSIITYSNLRTLFESLGKMKSNNDVSEKSLSIRKNRKSKEKMLLRKRESLHYFTDSNIFIAKRINNSKNKNLKQSEKMKSLKEDNSKCGHFKRLNNEIISKYYLFQKEKDQFNFLIKNSYNTIEKSDQINQSERIKLKKLFKGKYFRNLYQKLNNFQNNESDFCNNENYVSKFDKDNVHNKIWNFSIKNSKPLCSNQPDKKNISFTQSNINEKTINDNSKAIELLKTKVDIPTIQVKPIESNENDHVLKSELSQSLELLKKSALPVSKKTKEENFVEKDKSKFVSDIIEKTNTVASNEVAQVENVNPVSNNAKRNRRSKHSRSSAVCLSSNDIKDILNETKLNEKSTSRSFSDKPKDIQHNVSKAQLERKKLLSRDYYHPSLNTLNFNHVCYNEYYPSVSLPSVQESSQFLQFINNRRLNV